ncbi:MAG TPA: PIN domain-containing protein [Blastocatellia bacterium]|nr:PIN domain-containing protein [Blastocatellia bacterium]
MAVLIDTNIIARILAGDIGLAKMVINLDDPVINAIVWIETIQGSKSKSEIRSIEQYLDSYQLIPIDDEVSEEARRLIKQYSNSHGLMLADSIVAATCVVYNLELLTLNLKHFRFVSGLKLLRI